MLDQMQALAAAKPEALFAVFEGPDKVGKTTLMNAVVDSLRSQNKTVVTQREPGGTEMGEELRTIIKANRSETVAPETDIMLQMAVRRQNVVNTIVPGLADGHIVISDRFTLSTYAFNVVPFAQSEAQNDPLQMVFLGLMQVAIEGLIFEPLTFIVDIPEAVRQARLAATPADEMYRYERYTPEQQAKVLQVYKKYSKAPNTVVIDGTLPLDEQVAKVLTAIEQAQASQAEQVAKAIEKLADYNEQMARLSDPDNKIDARYAQAEPVAEETPPTPEEAYERFLNTVMVPELYAQNDLHAGRMAKGRERLIAMLDKTFEIVGGRDVFFGDQNQQKELADRFRSMEYYASMRDDVDHNVTRSADELKAEAKARIEQNQADVLGLREASPEEVAEARQTAV